MTHTHTYIIVIPIKAPTPPVQIKPAYHWLTVTGNRHSWPTLNLWVLAGVPGLHMAHHWLRCPPHQVARFGCSSLGGWCMPMALSVTSAPDQSLICCLSAPSQQSSYYCTLNSCPKHVNKGCKVVTSSSVFLCCIYLKHYSRIDVGQSSQVSLHCNNYLCFTCFPSSIKSWTDVEKVLLLSAVLAGRHHPVTAFKKTVHLFLHFGSKVL